MPWSASAGWSAARSAGVHSCSAATPSRTIQTRRSPADRRHARSRRRPRQAGHGQHLGAGRRPRRGDRPDSPARSPSEHPDKIIDYTRAWPLDWREAGSTLACGGRLEAGSANGRADRRRPCVRHGGDRGDDRARRQDRLRAAHLFVDLAQRQSHRPPQRRREDRRARPRAGRFRAALRAAAPEARLPHSLASQSDADHHAGEPPARDRRDRPQAQCLADRGFDLRRAARRAADADLGLRCRNAPSTSAVFPRPSRPACVADGSPARPTSRRASRSRTRWSPAACPSCWRNWPRAW